MARQKPKQKLPVDQKPEVDQTAEQALWNAAIKRRRDALRSALYPPPLGVMPRKVFLERRVGNILDACVRYKAAGRTPKLEWIEELYTRIEELEGL